jgi:hypothetical protein
MRDGWLEQGRRQLRGGALHRLHQELAATGHPAGPQPGGRDARRLILLPCRHWSPSGQFLAPLVAFRTVPHPIGRLQGSSLPPLVVFGRLPCRHWSPSGQFLTTLVAFRAIPHPIGRLQVSSSPPIGCLFVGCLVAIGRFRLVP